MMHTPWYTRLQSRSSSPAMTRLKSRVPESKRWYACSALLILASTACLPAAEPIRTAWIMSPPASPGLARILPDVHAVEASDQSVTVRSAGISLRYLGPLEAPPIPNEAPREFVFTLPRASRPGQGTHARLPAGIAGVFLNGMPIYNQFEALSFNGSNLWHYDAVAYEDDGALTAAGHPRAELIHPATAGLLEQLIAGGARHSPLIGFAADGYPIYGPWGYANPDGTGGLRRMGSSYKLRPISRRHDHPDGTELTPEQYGPDVTADNPLGTFAEDYEYVRGSGDLDEFNGRFTVTPDYPAGTYAYFLATDDSERLAFPYLIGPRFYGNLPAATDGVFFTISKQRIELSASESRLKAGHPIRFRLAARDTRGEPIRHFEYVHERPIHLLVASADLAEFDHIHPELTADDSYQVTYSFAHGGRYRMWADYSLPGEPPHVESFDVTVEGPTAGPRPLTASPSCLELIPSRPLRAGEDIPITLRFHTSLETLEPYLGAWAHVIVISQDLQSFAHAHPIDAAVSLAGPGHTHAAPGPPPNEVRIITNFSAPGLYKLWAQYQQSGQVVTAPFVLRIGPAEATERAKTAIPAGAIKVQVTQHGYEPATVKFPANQPVTLAFTRDTTPNCGSEVVFPTLGIRRQIPLGGAILIELPPQPAGEIAFSCGMGMYRGMMVAR